MNRRNFNKTIIGGILSAPFVSFLSKTNEPTPNNKFYLFTTILFSYDRNHPNYCWASGADLNGFYGNKKELLNEAEKLFLYDDSVFFNSYNLETYIILSTNSTLPEVFLPAWMRIEGENIEELKRKYLIQLNVVLNHSDFMRDHNKDFGLINNFVGGGANS